VEDRVGEGWERLDARKQTSEVARIREALETRSWEWGGGSKYRAFRSKDEKTDELLNWFIRKEIDSVRYSATGKGILGRNQKPVEVVDPLPEGSSR
jgi:hypothetical protein